MFSEFCLVCELPTTLVTRERLLSTVRSLVGLHGSLPGEASATFWTMEGLLLVVLAKMGLQTLL